MLPLLFVVEGAAEECGLPFVARRHAGARAAADAAATVLLEDSRRADHLHDAAEGHRKRGALQRLAATWREFHRLSFSLRERRVRGASKRRVALRLFSGARSKKRDAKTAPRAAFPIP